MNLKAIFPCAFTVGNLVSGFLAITFAASGHYQTSASLICLGAILDGLDGFLARTVLGSSRFGQELDSFADFVTFGVAPLVLIYPYLLHSVGLWSWLLSGIYLVAGAFRLIRHNLEDAECHQLGFRGMPITSGGIALAGLVLFSWELQGSISWPGFLIGLILGLSILMVSTIRFPRFELFKPYYPVWLKFFLSICFALPLIIRPQIMILVMILGYIGLILLMEICKIPFRQKAEEKLY